MKYRIVGNNFELDNGFEGFTDVESVKTKPGEAITFNFNALEELIEFQNEKGILDSDLYMLFENGESIKFNIFRVVKAYVRDKENA